MIQEPYITRCADKYRMLAPHVSAVLLQLLTPFVPHDVRNFRRSLPDSDLAKSTGKCQVVESCVTQTRLQPRVTMVASSMGSVATVPYTPAERRSWRKTDGVSTLECNGTTPIPTVGCNCGMWFLFDHACIQTRRAYPSKGRRYALRLDHQDIADRSCPASSFWSSRVVTQTSVSFDRPPAKGQECGSLIGLRWGRSRCVGVCGYGAIHLPICQAATHCQ